MYVQQSHFVAANSRGFIAGYPYSRHTCRWRRSPARAPTCSATTGTRRRAIRRSWPSRKRVGRYAAERALARLNARKLDTRKCPVLFEAPLAAGLLGAFVQATSGGALYRKSTFLLDSLGKQVFAPHIQIVEDPHVIGGVGSRRSTKKACAPQRRKVVKDGVVQGYFLSTYSARKLGMKTTGNAGGSHNLSLTSSADASRPTTSKACCSKMGTGLLVTELMGQGVNYVTGDYSRGASGFWVENGVIQYPVEEITIAGNMKDMFQQIVAIGADS